MMDPMAASAPSTDTAPLLRLSGVEKSFGTVRVLHGVDLEVKRGQVVTVIGPSGSGKTTLLRCVNFLEVYDAGSIRIDGKEVGYRDLARRRMRSEQDLARVRAETGAVGRKYSDWKDCQGLRVHRSASTSKSMPDARAR